MKSIVKNSKKTSIYEAREFVGQTMKQGSLLALSYTGIVGTPSERV
jgi:hypothetical protein